MAFDEDQPPRIEARRGGRQATPNREQGVDAGIAGDVDVPGDGRLGGKIGGGGASRREQQCGTRVDRDAVAFLGPRPGEIVRAQACFYMSDGDAEAIGGEGGCQRRAGVALDQQQVGAVAFEQMYDAGPDRGDGFVGCGSRECWKPMVDRKAEISQRLVEDPLVLTGRD